MNLNESRAFWISIGVALLSVFLLYSYTQEKTEALTKEYGLKSKIVVASKDIHEMVTVLDDMVEVIELPKNFVQPGHFKDPEDIIGKVALAPIRKGEQILDTKIMIPGPLTGLSHQIEPRKRALTIPVNGPKSISGLIKPGDRVDMLVSLENDAQKRVIQTLLQGVPVLATGLNVVNELPRIHKNEGEQDYIKNIRGETNYDAITVEVSPSDAQKLVYVLSVSPNSLFLLLRHPTDNEVTRLPQAGLNHVLNRLPSSVSVKKKRGAINRRK